MDTSLHTNIAAPAAPVAAPAAPVAAPVAAVAAPAITQTVLLPSPAGEAIAAGVNTPIRFNSFFQNGTAIPSSRLPGVTYHVSSTIGEGGMGTAYRVVASNPLGTPSIENLKTYVLKTIKLSHLDLIHEVESIAASAATNPDSIVNLLSASGNLAQTSVLAKLTDDQRTKFQTFLKTSHTPSEIKGFLMNLIEPAVLRDAKRPVIRAGREIEFLTTISHPKIVSAYDSYIDPLSDTAFIVMEDMVGGNLEIATANSTYNDSYLFSNLANVCDALQYAHDQGIVHRDVKPENILISDINEFKLADFGLAKRMGDTNATATIAGAGSPPYMAPEQVLNARDVTEKADVFAMALVILGIAEGGQPFKDLGPKFISCSNEIDTYELITLKDTWDPSYIYSFKEQMKKGKYRIQLSQNARNRLGDSLANLVEKSLLGSPSERPMANELAQDLRIRAIELDTQGSTFPPNITSVLPAQNLPNLGKPSRFSHLKRAWHFFLRSIVG